MGEQKTSLSQRILTRLAELGMTQAELARKAGLTTAAINAWVRGNVSDLKADSLIAAASALRVRPRWLASGNGPKELSTESFNHLIVTLDEIENGNSSGDYVMVPEYVLNTSPEGGYIVESENPDAITAVYRIDWLRSIGLNPQDARRFSIRGDSMEPTLFNGDRILVDISQNNPARIQDGAVYAIRYGEHLIVRRLRRKLNGHIILVSDNPAYSDEEITASDSDYFAIIGRVLERSGTAGL